MLQLSDEQLVIENTFKNTNHNIVVDACPGSGKSTTIIHLIQSKDHKGLYMCFNKSIREEIQRKFESKNITNCDATTFHALGLKILRKAFGKNIYIDKRKNFNNWKAFVKENKRTIFNRMPFELQKKIMISIFSIHDYYRNSMIKKVDEIILYLSNILNTYIVDLEEEYKEFYDPTRYTFLNYTLSDIYKKYFLFYRQNLKNGNQLIIDFPDMIFLPLHLNINMTMSHLYDVLYIDESQDLNLAQHEFINRLKIKRFVSVGDQRQSLYLFSGSKNNSIEIFKQKENTVELPLHTCYRCPENVVDEANKVYNIIKPFKSKSTNPITKFDEKHISNIKDNSMILCRNVAPLYDLYFKLLNENKDCFINDDVFYLKIRKLAKQYPKDTISDIIFKIEKKMDQIKKSDLSKEDKGLQIAIQMDLKKILNLVNNNTSISKITDLVEFFKNSTQNIENAIMLSSIHKAKGLERDYVYLLNRNLIPSEHAISKESLIQENNLLYVAITRAKKEFNYLSLSNVK